MTGSTLSVCETVEEKVVLGSSCGYRDRVSHEDPDPDGFGEMTHAGLVHEEQEELLRPKELRVTQDGEREGPSRFERSTRQGDLGWPSVGEIIRYRDGRRARGG